MILTDEFSRQASMEQDLGIPTALYAAPVREIVELGKSQIGFMNMFAIPLFQGVTDVMPDMEFAVNELHLNKSTWEGKIQEEQAKARQDSDDSALMDGVFSPRTMSLATSSTASHHKSNTTPSTARSSNDSEIRIKALLNKSPFSPPNGALQESTEPVHYTSVPAFSTTSPTDSNPSPSDVAPDASRRSSKPSQLQFDSQDASPLSRELKDVYTRGDEEYLSSFVKAESTTTSDPVLSAHLDQNANGIAQDHQRTSDTTDDSISAETESASQATSATTNRMPLSPTSRGTSVRSDASLEKSHTPTAAVPGRATPPTGSSTSTPVNGSPDEHSARSESNEGRSALMGTVRNLKKKPSRFRVNSLNFWRKNKSDSPPVPAEVRGDKLTPGSEDEGNHWS
jgi:3',5'-cyclic-nucleotide phosphodiesterase